MFSICQNRPVHSLLLLCLVVCLGWHCGPPSDAVVARFGKQKILLGEFKIGYLDLLKKPHVLDSAELRENFLNEMINQRLIAAAARARGLQNDDKFRYRVDAYRDKCLRDAHYQEIIQPQIRVDEEKLREVYSYITQQRHLRHFFFKTEEEADQYYQRLLDGESWDALAAEVIADSLLACNGGDLGWVYWDQLEYEMGLAAFRLKVDAISAPVSSSFGFHIVKVVDYRIDPLVSETEFDQRRRKVKFMLEKKIGDKLAADYITAMMTAKHLQVRTDILRILSQKFMSPFSRNPSPYDQMLEAQLTPAETRALENKFWDYRNATLVIIDGKPLTVGEFIYQLNYVPFAAVRQGFKTALDFVIRDRVLTDEARQMKLERKYPAVRQKAVIYEDYLLQTELRRDLVRSIEISEAAIGDRFERDRNSLYKQLELGEVRDTIYEILVQEARQRVVSDLIAELRSQQSIRTDYRPIHTYYDNLKNASTENEN